MFFEVLSGSAQRTDNRLEEARNKGDVREHVGCWYSIGTSAQKEVRH